MAKALEVFFTLLYSNTVFFLKCTLPNMDLCKYIRAHWVTQVGNTLVVQDYQQISKTNKIALSTFLQPHTLGYCYHHPHLPFTYSVIELYLIFKAKMSFHSLWTTLQRFLFFLQKLIFLFDLISLPTFISYCTYFFLFQHICLPLQSVKSCRGRLEPHKFYIGNFIDFEQELAQIKVTLQILLKTTQCTL